MEVETAEIALEQREGAEEALLAELPPEPALPAPAADQPTADPPAADPPAADLPAADPPSARGRPWAKGQSGNPAGRPPRFHPPAAVADYMISRKTIPLAKKVRKMALDGNEKMLALWYQHQMALSRRAGPDWFGLPLVADRAELRGLREAVSDAAATGAISAEQADALVRIVNTVMGLL